MGVTIFKLPSAFSESGHTHTHAATTGQTATDHHTTAVLADGTVALTADWDAGAFKITANEFRLNDNEPITLGDAGDATILFNGSSLVLKGDGVEQIAIGPDRISLSADLEVSNNTVLNVADTADTISFSPNQTNFLKIITVLNPADTTSNIVMQLIGNDRADPFGQANDEASIRFDLDDDAGAGAQFARLVWVAVDPAAASKDGAIEFDVMVADSLTKILTINGSGIDVVGNIIVSGTVDGVDIAARDHAKYTDAEAITAVEGEATLDVQVLTATSYDGVLAANLLDKTATESISGAYTHTALLKSVLASAAVDFQNTTASAGEDQVAIFRSGNKTDGAPNDGGYLSFFSDDNAENQQEYARLRWRVTDAAAGAVDAQLHFQVALNSSLTTGLTVDSGGIQAAEGAFTGDFSIDGDLDMSGGPGTIFVDNIDSGTGDTTTIDQKLAVTGLSTLSGGVPSLGIGTPTVPHGGVGAALLSIEGANASTVSGPHVTITTASDDFPLVQYLNFTHDNIEWAFDAYFDGSWKSSDAGSNFLILKFGDQFRLWYQDAISPGDPITGGDVWNVAWTVDATTGLMTMFHGLTITTGNVLFNTDATNGVSFRVSGDTDASLLHVNGTADAVGINVALPAAKLDIVQDVTNFALPTLRLNQADVSEQCLMFSSSASDIDINLFTVEVTGTPTLMWDESEDDFNFSAGVTVESREVNRYAYSVGRC